MAHSSTHDLDEIENHHEHTTQIHDTVIPEDHSVHKAILQNPTRQSLHDNFTKSQLQKYCRQIGLNGIWVTKDKLIDMIINHVATESASHVVDHQVLNQEINAASLSQRLDKYINETDSKLSALSLSLQFKDEEIESLRKSLKVTEGKIQNLMSRLQKYESNTGTSVNEPVAQSAIKTLLLGDSFLSEIRASDLGENSIIRTIPEGNFDLLKSWVTDKLDYPLKECIIYCGLQDLLEKDCNIDKTLDDLGALVAELKCKNENIIVTVCELIPTMSSPRMQDKIANYNIKLTGWCARNEISLNSTELFFRLGTGEMDANCFNLDDENANQELTRIGAIRLLDAISKKCPNFTCKDWQKVKLNSLKPLHKNEFTNVNVRLHRHFNNYHSFQNNRNNFDKYNNRKESAYEEDYDHSVKPSRNTDYQDRQLEYHRGPIPHRWTPSPHHSPLEQNLSRYHNMKQSNTERKIGCFNCGELNHHHQHCRFDHKLKCGNCNQLGHKSKLCNNYRR